METDIRDELAEEFERQAEWRREMAGPAEDDRNAEAAALFDNLASTVNDMDLEVLQAYRDLRANNEDAEQHSEFVRQIGFHKWPNTAEEFCRDYIAERFGR